MAKTRLETTRQRVVVEEQHRREEQELRESQTRQRGAAAAARRAAEAHATSEARDWARRRLAEERAEAEMRAAAQRRLFEEAAHAEAERRRRWRADSAPPPRLTPLPREAALLPIGEDLDSLSTDVLAQHTLRHQGCPHRCLGLAPNARAQVVRKRYLALARRLHPDKTEHPQAAKAFAAVEAAARGMEPHR